MKQNKKNAPANSKQKIIESSSDEVVAQTNKDIFVACFVVSLFANFYIFVYWLTLAVMRSQA